MAKIYCWNQLGPLLAQTPQGTVAVLDLRSAQEAASNPNLNNGQRFTDFANLKQWVDLEVWGGPSHGNPGGNYNDAPAGSLVWELVAIVVRTHSASILWGYAIDQNGELWSNPLVFARCWDSLGPADSALNVKPDYAFNARAVEWQLQNDGEFEIAFSAAGGYIGPNLKGPFRMWPLIAASPGANDAVASQGLLDFGPWGGTKYTRPEGVWMLRAKGGGGGGTPPPANGHYLSMVVNGQEVKRLYGVPPNVTPPDNTYLSLFDPAGNELRRFTE